MEGDVHPVASRFHHTVASLQVYVAIGCKRTYHHTLGTQFAGYLYIVNHTVHLILGIHKVASTRPD